MSAMESSRVMTTTWNCHFYQSNLKSGMCTNYNIYNVYNNFNSKLDQLSIFVFTYELWCITSLLTIQFFVNQNSDWISWYFLRMNFCSKHLYNHFVFIFLFQSLLYLVARMRLPRMVATLGTVFGFISFSTRGSREWYPNLKLKNKSLKFNLNS